MATQTLKEKMALSIVSQLLDILTKKGIVINTKLRKEIDAWTYMYD